ncbi:hypothetical protein [Shewanella frigidimarina]|uniref:Uncharacterized protein n=1 Tax=Shewanella frigidimarina TaxID=56812 RepID=A0A119D0J6_SHEFR|nr:hypothetical protein [Shewanella frigidimarina]KVX03037.1 hypothetical protein AWJ07_00200 [Shewanella frigidimarina]
MIILKTYRKETEALLFLLDSENQFGIGYSEISSLTERIWIQESQDFDSIDNFMRDDYNNPCVEDYDMTLLIRLALACWDNKLPKSAKDVKAFCAIRSGKYTMEEDSPFYSLWTLFLKNNDSLMNLISTSSDPALQPSVLLEQAELMLDKHYQTIQRLNRRYGGDPRRLTQTEWFKSKLPLPARTTESSPREPNKAFNRDFVSIMLAAKIVMHFHPSSSLLQALALAPEHYAVGQSGYEYWFRRTLRKHCATQQGWLFLLMNMPKFAPEELMYLMSRVPVDVNVCDILIEAFDEYYDEETQENTKYWYRDKSEYMDYFEKYFQMGDLLGC